jgi:thioredoxin reductase (NADPH)
MIKDVVIIGGGPGGCTAAIYTARARMNPLMLVGAPGGQLGLTTEVGNFPGFPEEIRGPDLMKRMEEQALAYGAEIMQKVVTAVELSSTPLQIKCDHDVFESRSLIIATGSNPRKLGIPGEREYSGRGVSYCATCDGFFFKDQVIAVVGGGDTAVEEASFLSRFGSKIYVIHRRDQLRASVIMQEQALANEKISFIWDTVVEEVLGDTDAGVKGLRLKNVKTGEERDLEVGGFFVAIGHTPNSDLFKGQLDMDEKGYVIADGRQRTNVPGVFVAGDVADHVYKQAVTAAGTGCKAAIEAERFVAEQQHKGYPGC